jgi:hypothetical protein
MNRPDLHWIAQQLHSGRTPDEVSLAGVNLSAIARLELAQQALMEFPTEASLWAGSNEVVLPERNTPGNIQPFNRFPQQAYYWAQSTSWQNTDSARAYRVWMEAWEQEIPSPSLPSRTGGANLNLDAAKTLRGIPDEPAG